MAGTITFLELKTAVREAANMERSNFVSPTELARKINASWKIFHNIIVTKFEEYYVAEPVDFTVDADETEADLPDDFFKLTSLSRDIGGEFKTLTQFPSNQRNSRNRINSRYPRYRLYGNKIIFSPTDLAPGDYRLEYISTATAMVDDDDEIDCVNGWEQWIVLDAARKCLSKEESSTSELVDQQREIRKLIDESALNRDIGVCQQIQDVTAVDYDEVDPYFQRY